MPCNYKEYPDNWKELVKVILARANNKCELCFAENKAILYRDKSGQWFYPSDLRPFRKYKKVKIILTVHHIDSNKKNNNLLNLIGLCQRCHLKLDLRKHISNRKNKNKQKEILL